MASSRLNPIQVYNHAKKFIDNEEKIKLLNMNYEFFDKGVVFPKSNFLVIKLSVNGFEIKFKHSLHAKSKEDPNGEIIDKLIERLIQIKKICE